MSSKKVTTQDSADGVVNPKGLLSAGVGVIFIAAVPLTSFLTQPGGLVEKAVYGSMRTLAWAGTAGATSAISQKSMIPALSALYIAMTYALTGAASAAGVGSAYKEGRDNKHPRAQISNLTGLPLRLYSAHYNLMEMFPGFALAAALTQSIAPGNQQLINLLGFHVLNKCAVYYPAYLMNYDIPRSLSHILATASIINVAWRLANGET